MKTMGEDGEFCFTAAEPFARADVFLSGCMPDLTRSALKKIFEGGGVTVNGRACKPSQSLKAGDAVKLNVPPAEEYAVKPEPIPLDIVYQDGDIAVINKPQGMTVHMGNGNREGTLVNALLYNLDSLSGINGVIRPGIVHRIDKDTTGLLLVCKNDMAHISLSEQLSEHSIKRRYRALVYGGFNEDEGTVDAPIGRRKDDRKKMGVVADGRSAVTHFKVLERFRDISYIECRLETGRTHQIRVHMSHIGHPLLGDEVYGRKKDPYAGNGQYLHAYKLGFVHPRTGEYMEFDSPMPAYFEETLEKLR